MLPRRGYGEPDLVARRVHGDVGRDGLHYLRLGLRDVDLGAGGAFVVADLTTLVRLRLGGRLGDLRLCLADFRELGLGLVDGRLNLRRQGDLDQVEPDAGEEVAAKGGFEVSQQGAVDGILDLGDVAVVGAGFPGHGGRGDRLRRRVLHERAGRDQLGAAEVGYLRTQVVIDDRPDDLIEEGQPTVVAI